MLVILTIIFTLAFTLHFSSKYQYAQSIHAKNEYKNKYVNWMCAFFAILAGLRNVAVGPDTYAYYMQFLQVEDMPLSAVWKNLIDYYVNGIGKDAGFPVLLKLFQYIFPSFRFFLIIVAIVFYSGAAYIIRTNTQTITQAFLSVVLFITLFQVYAFSAIRQDLALGCVMWSYKCIKERHLVLFVCLIFLASTVHKSVLIFLPYYWIATLKNVKTLLLIAIITIPLLFVFSRQFTGYLVEFSDSEQYAYYLMEEKDAGTPAFTALLFCCFVLYIFMVGTFNRHIPQHYLFTNTIFITLGLAPITWVVPELMRVLLYFSCFLPIIMAKALTLIPDNALRRYAVVGYVVVVTYLFVKTIPPYKFFWQEMALGFNYSFNISTIGI